MIIVGIMKYLKKYFSIALLLLGVLCTVTAVYVVWYSIPTDHIHGSLREGVARNMYVVAGVYTVLTLVSTWFVIRKRGKYLWLLLLNVLLYFIVTIILYFMSFMEIPCCVTL